MEDRFFRAIPKVRQIPLEIHGFRMDAESIRPRVGTCRTFNWHWQKSSWRARNLAVGKEGKISFDMSSRQTRRILI
jgi:hypothetical protein